VVEGWLIGEVGFFEVSLGNHRSDGYFCPSTLERKNTVANTTLVRKTKDKKTIGNGWAIPSGFQQPGLSGIVRMVSMRHFSRDCGAFVLAGGLPGRFGQGPTGKPSSFSTGGLQC